MEKPEKDLAVNLHNLEDKFLDAFRCSFPFFTYKELQQIFRYQYYQFVDELRREDPELRRKGKKWREIIGPTGTTEHGLRKMGYLKKIQEVGDNRLRRLLLVIQASGEDGIGMAKISGRFIHDLPDDMSTTLSLDEALEILLAIGEVVQRGGLYYSKKPVIDLSIRVRRVLAILQHSGERGLEITALAEQFYGEEAMTDFEETLSCMVRWGIVVKDGERYVAAETRYDKTRQGDVSADTIASIVTSASRIGEVVKRNSGDHDAGLYRATVTMPGNPEVVARFVQEVRGAVAQVTKRTEARTAEEGDHDALSVVTVVLGVASGTM